MSPLVAVAAALAGAGGWLAAARPLAVRRLVAVRGPSSVGWLASARRRALRMWGRWRPRPRRDALRRAAVIEICEGLAAELRAGRMPAEALRRVLAFSPMADELAPLLVAAGDDVVTALAAAGLAPGAAGLRRIAACWQVVAEVGAGLADLVERLAESLHDEQAHRDEVNAQVAGPRATTWLLTALPALGMLLGAAVGADPVGFLLGSPAGVACLLLGLALDVVGAVWMRRLTAVALPGGGR